MSLKTVKRLASRVLGVGESHVKILDAKRASEALTSDDVRSLISEGAIVGEQKMGVGRAKARFKQARLHAGRRRQKGSVKGGRKTRGKKKWISMTRGTRRLLASLKPSLKKGYYRNSYLKIKGGYFKSKAQLLQYLRDNKAFKS
ncbi:50S ribosomal protein L19e [Candidatus Micrarchaeota archaeon]|nr:50S ribosomal protein L19e [Candidatus Micrarchaeota archaeon]